MFKRKKIPAPVEQPDAISLAERLDAKIKQFIQSLKEDDVDCLTINIRCTRNHLLPNLPTHIYEVPAYIEQAGELVQHYGVTHKYESQIECCNYPFHYDIVKSYKVSSV